MENTETNVRVYRVYFGAINPLKTKQTHNHKITKVGKLQCYFPQFTS